VTNLFGRERDASRLDEVRARARAGTGSVVLDVTRTSGFLAVHVTLRRGRAPEKKRALYRAIADNAATGTRVEDVMVVLSANEAIDWSFAGGIAQYAPAD
jgi:hypothetical protein